MTADLPLLENLLTATGRGDRDAFAQIYDSTSAQVYRAISHQFHDPTKAEALTLRVFLEIWRTSPRFDPDVLPALLWIMTCTRRIARTPGDCPGNGVTGLTYR